MFLVKNLPKATAEHKPTSSQAFSGLSLSTKACTNLLAALSHCNNTKSVQSTDCTVYSQYLGSKKPLGGFTHYIYTGIATSSRSRISIILSDIPDVCSLIVNSSVHS